jgi:hypothetical protein
MADEKDPLDALRKLILELRASGMSRPDILRLIGVPSSSEFDSQVKALARFEEGGSLPSYLRARALTYFRKQLPDMDILDFSLYTEEATDCNNLHAQLKKFYKIPDNRVDEIEPQAAGRIFIYKKPVNPNRKRRICDPTPKSKGRIQLPTS